MECPAGDTEELEKVGDEGVEAPFAHHARCATVVAIQKGDNAILEAEVLVEGDGAQGA